VLLAICDNAVDLFGGKRLVHGMQQSSPVCDWN
jgi:hypothetical protein